MLYRATVVENIDPKGQGRIKFRFRQDNSVPVEKLPWAEPCTPLGGGDNIDGAGFFFIPERGSQVWIAYEQGDSNFPIWLGSSFYNEAGEQNPPIELKAAQEPLIRGIRTPSGHRLVFDDRNETETGDYPIHVQLLNRNGSGLRIQDGNGGGRGITLGFGTTGGQLKMTQIGTNLISNAGAGIYMNDNDNVYKFMNPKKNSGILIQQDSLILRGENAIAFQSPAQFKIDSNKGIYFKASGGAIELKASSIKQVSAGDINLQTGGSLNVNSNQFFFSGQLGSNFTVDLPIPGIPGLNQGNILLQTSGGGVLVRNGIPVVVPGTPPVNTTSFTMNDASMPISAGRMGIGDLTLGNALLEGRMGGIFISGTPMPLPGTAGGLGGRLPVPLAPITPTGLPGMPQPAVLGGNLFQLLTTLNSSLLTFLGIMTAATPSYVITPVGPGVLNPAVVAGLATLTTALTTLQTTYFNPAPGVPTNVLSSYVFIDG